MTAWPPNPNTVFWDGCSVPAERGCHLFMVEDQVIDSLVILILGYTPHENGASLNKRHQSPIGFCQARDSASERVLACSKRCPITKITVTFFNSSE